LNKQKIFVLIKNFAWTNEDVELFKTSKKAKQAFKEYTGLAFNNKYLLQDNEEYNEKFSETKIYELNLPYFLEFRKAIKE